MYTGIHVLLVICSVAWILHMFVDSMEYPSIHGLAQATNCQMPAGYEINVNISWILPVLYVSQIAITTTGLEYASDVLATSHVGITSIDLLHSFWYYTCTGIGTTCRTCY